MAFGDYHPCDRCGERKTFYDANMDYEVLNNGTILYGGHQVVALCRECIQTHEVKIVPREPRP